jgi:hypothetical protein
MNIEDNRSVVSSRSILRFLLAVIVLAVAAYAIYIAIWVYPFD